MSDLIEVRPPRKFTFERDFTWCGEPPAVFTLGLEKLIYSGSLRLWFYERQRIPFDCDPLRIRLDGGPRPYSATMLMRDLKEQLPEMPDALRLLGMAAVVQLDVLLLEPW